MSFLIMTVGGGLLAIPSYYLRKHYEGAPPVMISVAWAAIVVLIGGPVVIGSVQIMGTGVGIAGGMASGIVGICFGLLVMFPAVAMTWLNFADISALGFASFLYDSSIVSPPPSNYSRARAKANRGDLEGAVREFRVYFNENPKSPAPLFAATMCLELHGRFQEAAPIYQEIMRRFTKRGFIWGEAALRLSALYDNHLGNPEGARAVLEKLVDRAPTKEQRLRAIERLGRDRAPV